MSRGRIALMIGVTVPINRTEDARRFTSAATAGVRVTTRFTATVQATSPH
jgi:hypothetical protein